MLKLHKHYILPSALTSIPYICEIGIKLNSGVDYDDLMEDMQTQFRILNSHKKAIEYIKCTEVKGEVLMDKEKASEDKNKQSGNKDSAPVDLTKSVKVCYLHNTYICIVLQCIYAHVL